MDITKCPHCQGELKFDLKISRYVCQNCGEIWSWKLDVENQKMVMREWHIVDKCKPQYDKLKPVTLYENDN